MNRVISRTSCLKPAVPSLPSPIHEYIVINMIISNIVIRNKTIMTLNSLRTLKICVDQSERKKSEKYENKNIV